VTPRLDPTPAPAHLLAATDHERWEVETTLDELATPQRLATRPLRRRQPVGVRQERDGLLLAQYIVRAWMHAAALPHGREPDRLSFTRAVETLGRAIFDFQLVAPSHWPALSVRLLADLARDRLPPRRPRSAPRALKRARAKYVQRRPDYHATPRQAGTYAQRLCLQTPAAAPRASP
jgi:hypothetical protein